MGLLSTTKDISCNGIFNTAHFVKKTQTTLSHKTHTSLSKGFFEYSPKSGRKKSGGKWGYSLIKWRAYVLVWRLL